MKYVPKRLQGASDKWQGKSPFWRLDKFVVSLIKTNKPAPESDAVSPAPQSAGLYAIQMTVDQLF